MNKIAIQKFAIWARTELIEQVAQRAYQYGIDANGYGDASADSIGGRLLTAEEKAQRRELIQQIDAKGYEQVIEEVAYTWFNRFIALRFMEVNNYLPSHIRVFSDANGAFKPEILSDALHVDLPGLDTGKVAEYIENNDTEGLYRYLLLTQCNALNESLPRMFERMGGYTEMLLPNNILKPDSVLGRMVSDIPEEDWQDAVQIIGWLYQYYNTELKDDTFARLKKNVKITKERIPAATQLFTPDWIVRYMVENSLGRLWVEGHPNDELKSGWKYYLDEAKQEPEVEAQLAKLRAEYAAIKPEEIKVIDPCMGSGHILVYAFDVLMQIYTSAGWSEREAAQSILKNNLYGLDIDDRAAQLSYFAVMMKARQYDRRLLTRGIQPNVYAIHESNHIPSMAIEYFHQGDARLKTDIERLVAAMRDAKEYGSILNVAPVDFARLYIRFDEIRDEIHMMQPVVMNELLPLVQCAELLAQKYDVVVTNPPYMGGSGMDATLSGYVKKHYPDSKSDLFSCFIERGNQMVDVHGYNCMVTMQSWMFLSSFEKMREKVLSTKTITNLMHMENMVMGIAFGTAVTVFRNDHVNGYKGTYNQIKLQDIEKGVPKEFPVKGNRFAQTSTDNFSKIPGAPVAYWVSEKFCSLFNERKVCDYAEPRHGMSTGNNDLCLKLWFEVQFAKIFFSAASLDEFDASHCKYAPYKKGGNYRLWYGNDEYIIAYDTASRRVMEALSGYRASSTSFFFKPSINWSDVSSTYFGVRMSPQGFAFDGRGASMFCSETMQWYLAALLTTKFTSYTLNVLNPTLTFNIENIAAIPVIVEQESKADVDSISRQCVIEEKMDWDSYENSWNFKRNPLIPR